jgi:DNA-directed RNA polymerase specialized sigma24 family protein
MAYHYVASQKAMSNPIRVRSVGRDVEEAATANVTLHEILQGISDPLSRAIFRLFLEDWSQWDIADLFLLPALEVERRFHEAKDQLRPTVKAYRCSTRGVGNRR